MSLPGSRWTIELISEAGSPLRPNEDAYFVWQTDEICVAAVFDGVTQLLTFPSLARLVGPALTPGRFAATLARDTFLRNVIDDPMVSLRSLFHAANDAIAQAVSDSYGACSAEAIASREHTLIPLLADPRAVRLVLPATVATIARVDRRAATIEWAHLGDTALIALADSSTFVTHAPRLGAFGADVAYQALCEVSIDQSLIPPSLVNVPAEMLHIDNAGRFYHNYATPDGQPDSALGIGVLDGLPLMDAYLREGHLSLASCFGLLLCSDGFLWPQDPLKSQITLAQHIDTMTREVLAASMTDYLVALRQSVAARPHDNAIKLHDDATGIVVKW